MEGGVDGGGEVSGFGVGCVGGGVEPQRGNADMRRETGQKV